MNETPNAVLDQAAFQRVWRRVMPQDRADCPFTLEEPDLTPAPQPPALSPLAPLPAQVPPQSIPCLGEASMGALPTLEALMDMTAQAQRSYRALGRRMGRQSLPAVLSAEKGRQLRRLEAAYFLISGQKYTPAPTPAELPRSNALALRDRFRAEQRSSADLMDARQAAADPCLGQLFLELAQENHSFARRIRSRLEQG